jgi:hypothetical protein
LQVLEFIEWAMKEIMKNPRVVKKAQAEIREALRGKKTITEAEIRETLLAFSRRKGKKIFQPRVFLFFFHQFTKTSPLILHTCMQFILNFDPSHFSTFLAGTWQ